MAVINPPGFLQNAGATHTAEQFRNWHGLIVAGKMGATSLLPRGGVNPALGSALQVTQTGSPSMAVIIKAGHAIIPGSEGSKQGVYSVMNDGDTTLSIAAAHATLNRIDLVCFKVEDQAYSGSVNASSLVVVTGTPAGSPSAPSPPANSITLASVSIVALDTSITNAEITDLRWYMAGLGGLLSVKDQAERDTLTAYESLITYNRALDRIDVYDGASFRQYFPVYRAESVLGGSAGSVVFSSIPSTLRRIRITYTARSDQAVSAALMQVRINGDTGNNYKQQYQNVVNTTWSGAAADAQNTGYGGGFTGSSAPANIFGGGCIDIIGWDAPHTGSLVWIFNGNAFATGVANFFSFVGSSVYTGAAPYTSITLFPSGSANFISGSAFYLEGFYSA
jgi:hypothetical protein